MVMSPRPSALSSRERMLRAFACGEADHVPCCFMLFSALRSRCTSQEQFIREQLALGLDAKVHLPDLPLRFDPSVSIATWKAALAGEGPPVLHKEYRTPAGALTAAVHQTADWPYGDEVPLFDDYLIPRSQKFLVTGRNDLHALPFLLSPPTREDVRDFRDGAARLKALADAEGLVVAGGWGAWPGGDAGTGMGVDAAMWLAGMTPPLLWGMEQPDLLEELLDIIGGWNRQRMEVVLEAGPDLFVKRAWYESADLWSPALYRRFMLPHLRREVALVHEAGARFGYIMTSGVMPLLDLLLESGIDVLIGVDPIQGKGTDMAAMRRRVGGRICLWGGVNGFLTVEGGTPGEVERAVEEACRALGPRGMILSPVDNVRDGSEGTWRNVLALIRAWQRVAGIAGPG